MNNIQPLLNKCIANDRAAQKLLYHLHKRRLMSNIFRYTMDINLAQDILQEGFIKIFQNLKKFDSKKGAFESWTTRIVINEYLLYKRKKNELLFEDNLPDVIGDSESAMLAKLTVDELRKIINQLPEIHRVILNLYYFEEYSHEEISKLLGIKKSSSRAQLSRSKKILENIWFNLNLSATL